MGVYIVYYFFVILYFSIGVLSFMVFFSFGICFGWLKFFLFGVGVDFSDNVGFF